MVSSKGAPPFCFKVASSFWSTATLRFAALACFKPFTDLTDPSALPTPHTVGLLAPRSPASSSRPWPPRPPRSPVLGFWRASPAAETASLPVPLTSSLLRPALPPRRPCLHSDVALSRVGEVTCASHVTPEVLPFQIPPVAIWLLREPGFLFSRHPCIFGGRGVRSSRDSDS